MFDKILESISQEISEIKKSKKKKYINVEYYKLINKFAENHYTYEIYVSEYVSNIAEDTTIDLVSVKHKIEAQIISIDENQLIIIKTAEKLVEEIYKINMEFDPSFLLKNLSKCIESIDGKNFIVNEIKNGIEEINKINLDTDNIDFDGLNSSQINAIKLSEENQINLIWGPPGTGKTHTLAKIIFRAYLRDENILVLSTSNSALDQIILKLDKELYDDEKDNVYRAGNTNNNVAYRYTKDFKDFKDKDKNITFATLAKLSLDYNKLASFDLVVVDEISMVSLPYVFLAANKSKRNLVMLGDFRQLPPISMSEDNYYFKESIFDYLNISHKIDKSQEIPYLSMLDTQYRMVDDISKIISSVFYTNLLKCGVKEKSNNALNFINVDNSFYKNSYLSISDESYFNPMTIYILDEIIKNTPKDKEILVLSPFRPQQNILNAMFMDNKIHGRSLTIHKSQGTEADVVIFDLTTHKKTNKTDYHHFFIDKITKNLTNVALSRTKKKLYIIGSLQMLKDLSGKIILWKKLLEIIESKFEIIPTESYYKNKKDLQIKDIDFSNVKDFTIIDPYGEKSFYSIIMKQDNIPIRNYVSVEGTIKAEERRTITFRDMKLTDKLPSIVFIDDMIIFQEDEKQFFIRAEKTAKILKRVALEKYIDTIEVDRTSTFTLNCDKCGNNYILSNRLGYIFLSCPKCHNQKNIGKNESILIKDLYKIKCPDCNGEVIPRQKKGQSIYSFYGCSNYPHCKGMISMGKLAYSY